MALIGRAVDDVTVEMDCIGPPRYQTQFDPDCDGYSTITVAQKKGKVVRFALCERLSPFVRAPVVALAGRDELHVPCQARLFWVQGLRMWVVKCCVCAQGVRARGEPWTWKRTDT